MSRRIAAAVVLATLVAAACGDGDSATESTRSVAGASPTPSSLRRTRGGGHGEHTSIWVAWMNGALESAERVVAEILHTDVHPREAADLIASSI